MIGFVFGAVFGFAVCALFAGSKPEPCESCKYRRIGVNAVSGAMKEPCNSCCHKYQDHSEEITL